MDTTCHGGCAQPLDRYGLLDENRAWPYSRAMINAATILIVRRRRSLAVRAVVCV